MGVSLLGTETPIILIAWTSELKTRANLKEIDNSSIGLVNHGRCIRHFPDCALVLSILFYMEKTISGGFQISKGCSGQRPLRDDAKISRQGVISFEGIPILTLLYALTGNFCWSIGNLQETPSRRKTPSKKCRYQILALLSDIPMRGTLWNFFFSSDSLGFLLRFPCLPSITRANVTKFASGSINKSICGLWHFLLFKSGNT